MTLIPLLLATSLAPAQGSPALIDLQQVRIEEFKKIQAIRDRIRTSDPKAGDFPPAILNDSEIKKMGLGTPDGSQAIQEALTFRFDRGVLSDYHPIDFASKDPVLNYTTARFDDKGEPKFVTVKDGLGGQSLSIYKVKVTATPLPTKEKLAGQPQVIEQFFGPFTHDDALHELKYYEQQAGKGNPVRIKTEIVESESVPVALYDNAQGDVAVVLEKQPAQPLLFPDEPQLVLFNSSPDVVQQAYANKGKTPLPPIVRATLAVHQQSDVVDFEHVKRDLFLQVQKLRDEVSAKHPGNSDFPPELLQNPQFKSFGIELPKDQGVLLEALSYKPEGTVLQGYHPINWETDKAARYVTVVMGEGGKLIAGTLKDAYQNYTPTMMRIKVTPLALSAGLSSSKELYFGPVRPDYAEKLRGKPNQQTRVEEEKAQDLPLSIYTNDDGAVAFVYTGVPPQALLLPLAPVTPVVTDPVTAVQAILDAHDAEKGNALHKVPNVFFAVLKG